MPCVAWRPSQWEALGVYNHDPPPSPPFSPLEPLLGPEMPRVQGQALCVPQVHGDIQGGRQGQTSGRCPVLVWPHEVKAPLLWHMWSEVYLTKMNLSRSKTILANSLIKLDLVLTTFVESCWWNILRRDCGRCKEGGKQCGTPMQEWCQSPRNKGVCDIKIILHSWVKSIFFLGLPRHSFCKVHSIHNRSSLLLGSAIKVCTHFWLRNELRKSTFITIYLGTVPGVSTRTTSSALLRPSLRRAAASAQNV